MKQSQEQLNTVKKCEKRQMGFWDFNIHMIKVKKAFWCYLIARRKWHLNMNVIYAATWKEETYMYNTLTSEAIKIIHQLWEDLK